MPVLTARPALGPTFSQAVEHSMSGLIANRLKEMDIRTML